MARREKRPIYGGMEITTAMPLTALRHEFSRRLAQALADKGWSQAKLRQRMDELAPPDARRIGKAAVSKYLTGKILPASHRLALLSKALEVAPEELVPYQQAGDFSSSPVGEDDRVWVHIDKALPIEAAIEIQQVLRKYK